jgi:hypothetical protein
MSGNRHTLQAVRQVIYYALTTPPLTYTISGSSPITLSAANVSTRAPWNMAVGLTPQDPIPTPSIAFTVEGRSPTQMLAERDMMLKIWVSSNSTNLPGDVGPDDEVTEVYEAIRAILHGADDEAQISGAFPPPSLTRVATDLALGLSVRQCREIHAFPADYEKDSARWWISASYRIVAL